MNTNDIHEEWDVGIIADDLTSAADGAGPFVTRGRRAWIGWDGSPAQATPVLAIDTGSRSMPAALAARRVAQLTAQLASRPILYKTVDSTLRGHVALEMEACLRASGRQTLVFAPAFPAAGRTTVAGIQLVEGVPVAETVYGRDPVHPARHSELARLVPASVADVILLDASTQEQLDQQVAGLPAPQTILWVGSPGMAMALARRFAPSAAPASAARPLLARDDGILVAVGSANPRSQQQADAVEQMAGVTLLRGPRERQADPAQVLDRIAAQAAQLIRSTRTGAVIATGGDTMQAILGRLGIHDFEILREIDPGFALGRATRPDGTDLLVAMKAGGFGDDQVLRRAIASLRDGLPASQGDCA